MVDGRKPIPNRLWKHRKLTGLKQNEVAKKLGLRDGNLVSRWERGVAMPSAENLLKLSTLYNTLANELYHELCLEFIKELFKEDN